MGVKAKGIDFEVVKVDAVWCYEMVWTCDENQNDFVRREYEGMIEGEYVRRPILKRIKRVDRYCKGWKARVWLCLKGVQEQEKLEMFL